MTSYLLSQNNTNSTSDSSAMRCSRPLASAVGYLTGQGNLGDDALAQANQMGEPVEPAAPVLDTPIVVFGNLPGLERCGEALRRQGKRRERQTLVPGLCVICLRGEPLAHERAQPAQIGLC